MTNNNNTYNQPPMGQGMLAGMPELGPMPKGMPGQGPMGQGLAIGNRPRTWRERWMRRFGMDKTVLLTKGALTIPNWLTRKSMVFFFIAMFLCWFAFGFVPELSLWMVASISVVLFFYGGQAMSKSWERKNANKFVRNIFVAGLVIRLLWVLYLYYVFNPSHFNTTFGPAADVEWYIPFGQGIAKWITGEVDTSLSDIINHEFVAHIDDVGYPFWLGIVYAITDNFSDVFIPFFLKSLMGAYCAICIYHIAKRHFGEGTARMSAIFVCLNPNMIYWCGVMMKEAEMVFLCCLAVDNFDKVLSSGQRYTFRAFLPGMLAALALFFFRMSLGLAIFLAVFVHIVMASQRVMSVGKKIIAGFLVFFVFAISVGDRVMKESGIMYEDVQKGGQKTNMEWRSEREDGNAFARYAGAAVFAPLIFTLPFPTFNVASADQIVQMQLAGGSYIKNIFSYFVVLLMILFLISGEWRRHVFILAYTVGYLAILVGSSYAQSGRFHMPIIPMLMLFAAYGIQMGKSKQRIKNAFTVVLVTEVFVSLAWAWFKLAGRGMI